MTGMSYQTSEIIFHKDCASEQGYGRDFQLGEHLGRFAFGVIGGHADGLRTGREFRLEVQLDGQPITAVTSGDVESLTQLIRDEQDLVWLVHDSLAQQSMMASS